MTAQQLMDSRKFCLLMDDLATLWVKKRADEADKEFRLQAVLDYIGGNTQAIPKPVSIPEKPKPVIPEALQEIAQDPTLKLIGWFNEHKQALMEAATRPDGTIGAFIPNEYAPEFITTICNEYPELGFTVDANVAVYPGPRTLDKNGEHAASRTWVMPLRKR